jgi:glycosyltransferase involved in cell wall biosynthesis
MMCRGPTGGRPTVTVVIPAHNSEGHLMDAVRSAYHQTFPPSEVIVVDDGSTDRTQTILTGAAAEFPSFRWTAKANGGPASARNLGIKLATGELIAFLDHDDVWALTSWLVRWISLPASVASPCRSRR